MRVSEEQLAAVAKEVLETMAFAFEMPGEDAPVTGDLLRATVDFRGPFCGALSLTLPRAVMPDLVVNMLGVGEEEIPPEQDQRDAIGELANVICGNIVQVLAGPQPVFELAPPKIDLPKPTPASTPTGENVTHARISLEAGLAEVTLLLQPDNAQTHGTAHMAAPAPNAR
jgi:CheY-specific phosphatase CheX